jgi:hypothetical protein
MTNLSRPAGMKNLSSSLVKSVLGGHSLGAEWPPLGRQ